MGDKSAIEWCDATWNPVTGCSHVSPGCEHCYAEALSLRFGRSKHPWGAQWAAENVVLHPERVDQPLRWKRPRRVFVNSMSDLFHEQVPDEFIDKVFAVMKLAYWHTFQVLTKRPERALRWFSEEVATPPPHLRVAFACHDRPMHLVAAIKRYAAGDEGYIERGDFVDLWPLPNVWLGVSVEDQRRADERIPLLLQTPAAVRFLSVEPMLGRIDVTPWLARTRCGCGELPRAKDLIHRGGSDWQCPRCSGWAQPTAHVDWVIVGGESGPHFRPMDPEWARCLRGQCAEMGIPFLFKQWGGRTPKAGGRLLDGREWNEYPDSTPVLQSAVPR